MNKIKIIAAFIIIAVCRFAPVAAEEKQKEEKPLTKAQIVKLAAEYKRVMEDVKSTQEQRMEALRLLKGKKFVFEGKVDNKLNYFKKKILVVSDKTAKKVQYIDKRISEEIHEKGIFVTFKTLDESLSKLNIGDKVKITGTIAGDLKVLMKLKGSTPTMYNIRFTAMDVEKQ